MKIKYLLAPMLLSVFILFVGCGIQVPKAGDTIIPPLAEKQPSDGSKSTSSLNNMSNMSPLAQPATDMVYSLFDKRDAPLSIFADNKYLYLLRSSDSADALSYNDSNRAMGRYGDTIEVYDVENGSLIRKIKDSHIGRCSAFTVKESNLYTFDTITGNVSLFSSSGSFLSAYNTGLSDIYAAKVVISDNSCIVLKIREQDTGEMTLAVYNTESKKVNRFNASQLYISQDSGKPEINDFCLFSRNEILAALSNGRLGLFDLDKSIPEKSCVFPMTAGYMEYDGNVLYFSPEDNISLVAGNTANFTNAAAQKLVKRLLINDEFNWPQSNQELEEWLLNALQMPDANVNGRHYGMARNTKHLFFLDFIPTTPETGKNPVENFMVYRIMK